MIVVGFCFFGQGKGPEEWCWAGKGMEKGLGQIGKGLRDWVGVWGLVLAILTVLDDISQFTFFVGDFGAFLAREKGYQDTGAG